MIKDNLSYAKLKLSALISCFSAQVMLILNELAKAIVISSNSPPLKWGLTEPKVDLCLMYKGARFICLRFYHLKWFYYFLMLQSSTQSQAPIWISLLTGSQVRSSPYWGNILHNPDILFIHSLPYSPYLHFWQCMHINQYFPNWYLIFCTFLRS